MKKRFTLDLEFDIDPEVIKITNEEARKVMQDLFVDHFLTGGTTELLQISTTMEDVD